MRDNAALKRRIEAMEADVHRRASTDRDKFSVQVIVTLVCLQLLLLWIFNWPTFLDLLQCKPGLKSETFLETAVAMHLPFPSPTASMH